MFAGVHGTLKWDFPASHELQKLADGYFRKVGVSEVWLFGELYVLDEHGHTLPFNQTESILKAPKPNQDGLFRFAIFNYDYPPVGHRSFQSYRDAFRVHLSPHFSGTLVHPVKWEVGDVRALERRWVDDVLKDAYEGLVVMVDDDSYWKVKTQFNVDVVPIAMKKGKRWGEGMYSSVKVALMDKAGNFVELANPNAFGDHAQMKADTARWKKRKLYEEGDWFFFEPKEVAEIKYQEATTEADRDVFDRKTLRKIAETRGVSLRSPAFVRWRPDKSVIQTDLRLEQIPENVGSSGREDELGSMGVKVTPRARAAAQKRITPIEEKKHLLDEPEKVPRTGSILPDVETMFEIIKRPKRFGAPAVTMKELMDPEVLVSLIGATTPRPYYLDKVAAVSKMWHPAGKLYRFVRFSDAGLPDPPFAHLLLAFPPGHVAICGGSVRRWLTGLEPADYDLFVRKGISPKDAGPFLKKMGYRKVGIGPLGLAENWKRGDEPKVQVVTQYQTDPPVGVISKFDWTVVVMGVMREDAKNYVLYFHKNAIRHLQEGKLVAHRLPRGDGELVNYRYVKYVREGFTPTRITAHKVVCHACSVWDVKGKGKKVTYPAPWPIERWLEAIG